jgi:hypothetical protein
MDVFHGGILVGGLRWVEWRIPGCSEIVGMALREISHSHFRIVKIERGMTVVLATKV